ncbi:MAG: hypothetical protein IT371_15490 [Deltaproteobacteria bacterium]|nr:hypothetical protein [Deltaproteobacteria bacterium]
MLFAASIRRASLALLAPLALACGLEPEPESTNPPAESPGLYRTAPVAGAGGSAPAEADLTLRSRGLQAVGEPLRLLRVEPFTDGRAPQIHTAFGDRRVPQMLKVFKVSRPGGLAAGVEDGAPVQALQFSTRSGEGLRLPWGGPGMGGGLAGLVLYADADSLTIHYGGEDDPKRGYTLYLLGLKVDPELVALYERCVQDGRARLPVLAAGEQVGWAVRELLVAVRRYGTFLDPRLERDFYVGASLVEPSADDRMSRGPAPSPSPSPSPGTGAGSGSGASSSSTPVAARVQGRFCTSATVSFELSKPPAACETLDVTVRSLKSHSWVLLGIKPSAGEVVWLTKPADASCTGGCHWTFPAVKLPCVAGPYSLIFLKDATDNVPAKGTLIGACEP